MVTWIGWGIPQFSAWFPPWLKLKSGQLLSQHPVMSHVAAMSSPCVTWCHVVSRGVTWCQCMIVYRRTSSRDLLPDWGVRFLPRGLQRFRVIADTVLVLFLPRCQCRCPWWFAEIEHRGSWGEPGVADNYMGSFKTLSREEVTLVTLVHFSQSARRLRWIDRFQTEGREKLLHWKWWGKLLNIWSAVVMLWDWS